jgi:site-specific recombinase XerD
MRARNIAILYWLRDTGGRVSGLINARISGVNLRRGAIETVEKSRPVILYINPPARQALRAWLRLRDDLSPETDHVFISIKTREGLTREGVRHMLNSLAHQARVTGRHNPHAFRHAWARDFLLSGGELSRCSQLMHHSSIAITDLYYARWYDGELRAAHAKHSPGAKLPPPPEDE